ncbi:MAG TPA: aldehyde dehydrogenase family protein [Polyangium sp.]|nr:aldehyde dehydrogenase family protein [Polyangium sp.]
MHETPAVGPADIIAGRHIPLSGESIISTNPARPVDIVWRADSVLDHLDQAVDAATRAQVRWARLSEAQRFAALVRFRDLCRSRAADMAQLIARETGKTLWDARAEADLLAAKVDITLDASEHGGLRRVAGFEMSLGATRTGRTVFRPHGVMAVLGPYNFPAHLPNGHIIPALALGNAVVFKPSDKAPMVGQTLGAWLQEALGAEGAPEGVVNVVHGGADVATRLVTHPGTNGVLFTGSWPVGRRIMELCLDEPGRILALEMGGNSPTLVMPDADLRQAAIEVVRSAFVSTGQRCTCTRRLVVHRDIAEKFVRAIVAMTSRLTIGDPFDQPEPFMGPIITEEARRSVIDAQSRFAAQGARVLLEARRIETDAGGFYLSPGIVQVDRFALDAKGAGSDIEVFGPLLRISIAESFDDALLQVNATRFGLAASIFTKNAETMNRFFDETRAGCINVNTGTAGASSKLPFGGLGLSGNHRPAGAHSLDYCAYPVAGMVESSNAAPLPKGMTVDENDFG